MVPKREDPLVLAPTAQDYRIGRLLSSNANSVTRLQLAVFRVEYCKPRSIRVQLRDSAQGQN